MVMISGEMGGLGGRQMVEEDVEEEEEKWMFLRREIGGNEFG